MVFENCNATVIGEYNIQFDGYYSKNGEFDDSKEVNFSLRSNL